MWLVTHDVSVVADQELFEIPAYISAVPTRVGDRAEGRVQWVPPWAVDLKFGRQWKRHVVPLFCERADFLVGAWFLGTELIARHTNNGQIVVRCMKSLQIGVLWRKAARAGDVDQQNTSMASEGAKGGR